MPDPLSPEELDLFAAEHALGVLDGEERLRAIALQRSDPAFAAQVDDWQRRLSPLVQETAEAQPSERLWDRIAASVEATSAGAPQADWARRAGRWRAATFVTSALAASLAAVVLIPAGEQPSPAPEPSVAATLTPRHVAQLVSPEGKPLLALAYDPASGTIKVSTASLGTEGRVPELWIIPEGDAPRSLGELTADGSTRKIPPAAFQRYLQDGATLAITLERPEGIPHQAPTLPIIASGTLTSI